MDNGRGLFKSAASVRVKIEKTLQKEHDEQVAKIARAIDLMIRERNFIAHVSWDPCVTGSMHIIDSLEDAGYIVETCQDRIDPRDGSNKTYTMTIEIAH